ncbi:class I adenylate-forming enzyme family protein [Schleiferia thermophila]|jgi:fatty-acyl-CoA synthase|uniref:Fatty-acyl-CoA synthase n=1 Tax=Schleiferia thermophila TaxID=884107 RepID=A0A369A6P3_9FLAO|nr:long-chain fatty acid--CoA ligase [Schleiferia thermophila]KFD39468.1 AMP-dependent synthetase [Schleiferia thermophila str. Yellowstone]PMB29834.1 AMP-dependent synthetase [Fischerella thermalis CCMEE 5319]RCX04949.1 fatty-acyl-CoA synthase [Schleiferia thermophila]GCD79530.1 acid--CoA ligase [Schleiferia thermophila]
MIADWADRWSLYLPDKVALQETDTGRKFTYEQLNRLARQTAGYLQKSGIGKGDRIGVLSAFCAEYIVLFLAAQKAGFILVPINYRLTPPEVSYIISNAGCSMVFCSAELKSLWKDVQADVKESFIEELFPLSEGYNPDLSVEIAEDDPIFILYTSGTTGFPKGAIYTHKMLFWNSINTALRLKLHSDDSTLIVTPPFHTGGWNVLLTPLLHFGGTVYLMKKFDPESSLKILLQEGITLFMLVPTMVRMLSETDGFQSAEFSKLKYFIVGGEPLPVTLIQLWAEKGVPIRQGYGLTECGPNVTSLPEEDAIRKRGSIGFLNFYVDHQLVDEQGQVITGEGTGELWLKGPIVTPGYWQNPEATQNSLFNGWFKTGDVIYRDSEGYLYVVDRIKNMFISGGENVYPAEVEKYIQKHEAVSEVAVIGVPDERWGESGKAFISLKPGHHLTYDELRMFCQKGLAKYKIPKHLVLLDTLPKSDTGKIDRKKLRNM